MTDQPPADPVQQHYQDFLAKRYTWMCGDFEERVQQTKSWFHTLGLSSVKNALDLGCGSGIQSMALAEMGLDVLAVDFNQTLLHELEDRAKGLNVKTLHANLLALDKILPDDQQFDVVVCMGDTLTHLPDESSAEQMIQRAWSRLSQRGVLILEFRDLTFELKGSDRLIPVRLDQDELMLTFLEYHPTHVSVNDMSLKRTGDQWHLDKSSYPKLRLSPAQVSGWVEKLGAISGHTSMRRGVCRLVFKR